MNKDFLRIIKPLLLLLLAMTVYTPAEAVLKERNLSKTLSVLCAELEYNYKKEKRFIEKAEKRTKARRNDLISLTQRAQQI